MTIDWVHGIGQSPVCQILLQIVVRMLVTASPPACISSAGMLSTSDDFPFFKDLTAASNFITKNWEVNIFDVHRTIQYCCISFGLAVERLGAVLCPSVDNLSCFRDAFS